MTFIKKQTLFFFYCARLIFLAPLTFKLYVFCLFLCYPFLEIVYSPNSPKLKVVNIYIYAFVCACVYPFSPSLRSFMIVFFFFLFAPRRTRNSAAPIPSPSSVARMRNPASTGTGRRRLRRRYHRSLFGNSLSDCCFPSAGSACVRGVCVYRFFFIGDQRKNNRRSKQIRYLFLYIMHTCMTLRSYIIEQSGV